MFIYLFFDFQTYVNLEVYDDKDYVNFDVVTQKEVTKDRERYWQDTHIPFDQNIVLTSFTLFQTESNSTCQIDYLIFR